jgi:hypothetical protein
MEGSLTVGSSDEDAGLPLDQRHGVTMVIAMSDWRFGLFADVRR